jgi:hypothetical protein
MNRRVDFLIAITIINILFAMHASFGNFDSSWMPAVINRLLSADWDAGIGRVFTVLSLWEAMKVKKHVLSKLEQLNVWPWAEPLLAFVMSAITIFFFAHILLRV